MGEELHPEELLKRARMQAREFFEQYDAELAAIETTISKAHKHHTFDEDTMLMRDHLSLFLRSLSTELNNAAAEVRTTSERLSDLADKKFAVRSEDSSQ
jgi:hypothetical protein